jgi:class 3 adenylate cyclase
LPSLPTGTVTFLFTDIEGSTTLLQRLGDLRYAEVIAHHQRLLRDAFAKGNGQEVNTPVDGFLVAFPPARVR